MSENLDNQVRAAAAQLQPAIGRLYRRTSRMNLFNLAALMVPWSSMGVPLIADRLDLLPASCLAGAFINAVTTQITRWQKSSLVKEFNTLWNKTEPGQTRTLTLDFVRQCVDKKITHDTSVIGRSDFNIRDPQVSIPLAFAAYTTTVFAPVAPVIFFMGTQAREFRDNVYLHNTLRRTREFYDLILKS